MTAANNSGVYPVGDRVLIKPDPVKEQSDGGIIFAPETIEGQANAQVSGTLVWAGPDSWTDYQGPFAKVGDRVLYAKYHGRKVHGRDGEEYRLLNDNDITAIIDSDVDFNDLQGRKPVKDQ